MAGQSDSTQFPGRLPALWRFCGRAELTNADLLGKYRIRLRTDLCKLHNLPKSIRRKVV
jgi:hypothetical protein